MAVLFLLQQIEINRMFTLHLIVSILKKTQESKVKFEMENENLFTLPQMGVGMMLWLPNKKFTEQDIKNVFWACMENGLNFFDTAEIYGNGASEEILGKCLKESKSEVYVADKFAPPSKMNPLTQKRKSVKKDDPKALLEALDGSLKRLGVECIDLYQMHMPPQNDQIEEYMRYMADALKAGKIRAVGVCNFNAEQIERASLALKSEGYFLTSAMVGYNVIRRYPETNGVFEICEKENISIIPYAPLAEGTLTGKYRGGKKVPVQYAVTSYFGHLDLTKERNDGIPFLKRLFSKPRESDIKRMEPLMKVMENIAAIHGKTIAQVAINWLITQERVKVVPIPGVRSVKQAKENAGALGWALTKEEREAINRMEEATREV